jgi:hypothetical protein
MNASTAKAIQAGTMVLAYLLSENNLEVLENEKRLSSLNE